VTPSKEHLEKHYADLSDKPFFKGLITYMGSGPVCAMVWEGREVVKVGRQLLGATNPLASAPGTIRGDFAIVSCVPIIAHFFRPTVIVILVGVRSIGILIFVSQDVGRNVCHGSDAVDSAKKEIDLWFSKDEVNSWKQSNFDWIYEKA